MTSQLSSSTTRKIVFAPAVFAWLFCFGVIANAQMPPARIAVLDFGASTTGTRAAATIKRLFANDAASKEFLLVDSELATAAARGAGFQGSLNLTVQEARDLGAAIGCEFYFIGNAETLRRLPSTGSPYFESFASVFLVSARTGRLILWERPLERRDSAEEAEKALLHLLDSSDTLHRYQVALRRAVEDERAARTSAVEMPPPVIELMSDNDNSSPNQEVRPPRPYRRFKPPYPESAARAEVEAVVDVLVNIDARGEVGHIEIARWAGYGLDQAVVETIKQMHFFPAMRAGVAVPMRVLLRYNFRKPPK